MDVIAGAEREPAIEQGIAPRRGSRAECGRPKPELRRRDEQQRCADRGHRERAERSSQWVAAICVATRSCGVLGEREVACPNRGRTSPRRTNNS